MIRAGVNICFGFDATSLNPTSMFDQMRLAFNIASPAPNTPVSEGLTQTQCLEMGTINGTKSPSGKFGFMTRRLQQAA